MCDCVCVHVYLNALKIWFVDITLDGLISLKGILAFLLAMFSWHTYTHVTC